MSLLDIAQSIKKEGFDPRKDSANGPAPIPAGEYQAILKSVQFNVAESGWESLQYRFEIRGALEPAKAPSKPAPAKKEEAKEEKPKATKPQKTENISEDDLF